MNQVRSTREACRTRLFASSAAAVLLLPLTHGAPASAESPYNTGRVLAEQNSACLNAPGCTSLGVERRTVPVGGSVHLALQCPADRPYLVGWDARRHEHIAVDVIPSRLATTGLELVAYNQADAPGSVLVFLGCSDTPLRRTSVMEGAHAVPTNPAAVEGEQ